MSEVIKQVKVDNWGIYFLQRLKHFFNRTDYCDLTLQFQDNAQLKVHRLVLSACTEYFELLERTCEMYEDCLVMPDDLQADVVVPIINFMYTGQLEFKIDLLEKLYQTCLIMNMPVLTKLLSSHRNQPIVARSPAPAYYGKRYVKQPKSTPPTNSSNKRVFSSAFSNADTPKAKKVISLNKSDISFKNGSQDTSASYSQFSGFSEKKNQSSKGARPTRYELPEELEDENVFDNSFINISYTSKPLMVHPESTKQYGSKRISLFEEGTSSSRFIHTSSNNDIVECKKISVNESMFLDESSDMIVEENDIFQQSPQVKEEQKDANQLFDQIIENDVSNITIETKNKQSGNLDHAKIISEVLKKYPHLVKNNKQIKLKILNTTAAKETKGKKINRVNTLNNEEDRSKNKTDPRDFTYETDVIDSKEAARLIALGAENVKGPWICLICGTPGKALHFTSYYNFRKHLVEVHHEKPVPNICEYCGLKSLKRNYLVHHQLTKHGVEPPSHYNFPKCNYCDYVALNEALFVKHKMTHTELTNFKRNICNVEYAVSVINSQKTNNKMSNFDKKKNLMCMYCLRVFLRQKNLYAHLKTNHKEAAKADGLIYDSDDEPLEEEEKVTFKQNAEIKVEVPITYECDDVQYQLERRPDGNIHVVPKKSCVVMPKHKILNSSFISQQQVLPSINKTPQKAKNLNNPIKRNEYLQEICLSPSTSNIKQEEIIVIDNNEYIVKDFQLYPKNPTGDKEETVGTIIPTTSMEFHNMQTQTPETKMFIKKSTNLNQPLQIVVSNEEEYKTLIGTNQSVIFNETETGKTLAVLAASDTNTIETSAIDLNNTQTNDMMIIPDDFPINVSEAVTADNPNIVVVYSHPVEDPNKQYQLIATQEVGVEFVQSSEILTQSFETVTTCTSVASTHTTGEPWPVNVQATINKLPITSVADLQAMTVAQSVTVPCENNVNEYPEVSLASTMQNPLENKTIETQDIQNQYQESNNISSMDQVNTEIVSDQNSILAVEQTATPNIIQQETIIEPQIHSLPIDNITPNTVMNDLIQQLTAEQQSSISNPSPVVEIAQDVPSSVSIMSEANSVPNMHQSVIVNNDIQSIENIGNVDVDMVPSNSDTCSMHQIVASSSNEQIEPEVNTSSEIPEVIHKVDNIESIQNSEIPLNDENEVAETIENIAKVIGIDPNTLDKEVSLEVPQTSVNNAQNIIDNDDVTLKKVATVQIQSLTSEWSEDESDVTESVPCNSENVNAELTGNCIEKAVELEESIENIQQEVESHMPADIVVKSESVNVLPHVSANDMSDQSSGVKTTGTVIIPNEKISSLLNDWDDNDSQEEDVTSIVHPIKSEESTPTVHTLEVEVVKTEVNEDLNKDDKIKSLVSDWDEEDDENKD